MNADKLEAGPETDVLVAETVLGYKHDEVGNLLPPGFVGSAWSALAVSGAPPLSTEIWAAWEVETKIVDDTGAIMLLNDYGGPEGNFERYCCDFVKEHNPAEGGVSWGAEGWAATAPLAICRAALKAIQK